MLFYWSSNMYLKYMSGLNLGFTKYQTIVELYRLGSCTTTGSFEIQIDYHSIQ
jgi:hypothetical protein